MPKYRLLGVRLEPDLHRRFKLECVSQGRKMSDVARDLILSWLSEQEEQKPDDSFPAKTQKGGT